MNLNIAQKVNISKMINYKIQKQTRNNTSSFARMCNFAEIIFFVMHFRIFKLILILSVLAISSYAQNSISGNLSQLKSQTIRLVGFNGFGIYTLDSTQVNEQGDFKLTFSDKDLGMGYITAADNKPYFVVLAKEQIQIKGEVLSAADGIVILTGNENIAFVNYAKEHAKREQALSAWDYLQKIYLGDALFLSQKTAQASILSEIQRIKKQDAAFLTNLPASSYVTWYLPVRKLISSVSVVAQYKTEEIPATIAAFRSINYADSRLYKSGLLRDALESHYWLLENRGLALDTIFKDMNVSTDVLLKSVSKNESLYNEITKYLFDYFEKHSLFQSAEYLALKALSQKTIPLNSNLSKQLETYRIMKIGNIAPDILFTGDIVKNGSAINSPTRLSELSSKYKVVIFGASWCTACSEEMAQLLPLYKKWNAKGIEVVFVSMDTDKKTFLEYSSVMPFISTCDYKKWDTQAAKDYYVSSSPTIYLLGKNNEIILRPRLVKAIDAWVDYNMK
ncbi:thioredoxin-like domain-containing protein [Daejeonella sp.]|uniref:thioredoxin-like domain-containing protein n=1 Tax=Daejeonella sp. TaxID=2805397 RepID=UPI003783629B